MNPKTVLLQMGLQEVASAVNVMGGEEEGKAAICHQFHCLHRTLQQSFMRVVVMPILSSLAADYHTGQCDLRNLASASLAAKMLEGLTEDDKYLPLV